MDTDPIAPSLEAEPSQAATGSYDVVHAPRLMAGDRGASWVVEGWDLFQQAKVSWLLVALTSVIWLLLLEHYPLLKILDNVFAFAISAGLMLACHANYQRRPFNPAILLTGFSRLHLGRLLGANLVLIGFSLLLSGLVLGDLLWLIAGNQQLQMLVARMAAQADITNPDFLATLAELDQAVSVIGLLLRLTLILLLLLPVFAAAWFAPALIVLGNCDIKTALLYSLQATMKNVLSFLIYGVLLLILALLALLPYHIGYLLLIPVYQLSVYLSYRDIFVN